MNNFNQSDMGDKILYSNWVRYDTLKILIDNYYSGSDATELNIYIDLTSIIHSIYKSYNGKKMFSDPYILSSRIINMVAHYRQFFYSRYKVSTKFFIIYSVLDKELYRKFYKSYDNSSPDSFVPGLTDVLNTNIELLKMLSPYIPDIQFIETKYEMGVRVIEIAKKEYLLTNKNIPSIIITKDLYNMQLVNCPQLEGVTDMLLIRPKKTLGNDTSFIIHKNNAIDSYIHLRKNNPIANNISSQLLSMIMALTRTPERNIKNLVNVPKAIKTINVLIATGELLNGRNSDAIYFGNLFNSQGGNINPYELDLRFKAIDLSFQYNIYETNPEITDYCGIINLFNPEEVKKVNQLYYKNCPLDLNVL